MGVVDLIMIGHLGASAIAAVGIAGMVGWTFISLCIAFRTGTQMNPNRFGFGLSYKLNKIELSYSLLTHHLLSASNLLSVKVSFDK